MSDLARNRVLMVLVTAISAGLTLWTVGFAWRYNER